jgi:anthranilate synthase component 1
LIKVHQEGPACHTGDRTFRRRLRPSRVNAEISPSLEEFRKLAIDRRVIPVSRRLLADSETAIGLYRKLAANRPGTYLLESAEQGTWSRYSFVGVRAAATLTESDGEAHWTGQAPVGLPVGGDPLVALAETLRLLHTPRISGLPPSPGWWVISATTPSVGSRSSDGNRVTSTSRSWHSCSPRPAVLDHHDSEVGWSPTRSTSTPPTSASTRRTRTPSNESRR